MASSFVGALLGAFVGETAATRTDDGVGATLRIVDLISEGPIVGLAEDEKGNESIFINDLPLQGRGGDFNYNGVKWTFLLGDDEQNAPSSFGVVESTHAVGRMVEQGEPVVFRVSGRSVDAVRLVLRFPALFEQKDDGSTVGASAQLKFEAKLSSSTEYTDVGTAYVSRKSTSPFERNYRVDFSTLRSEDLSDIDENVDIRVSRLDAKSTSLQIHNSSFVASYVSISETPVAYSDSAVCAMEIDAEAFSNSPAKRTFDILGIRVQIPSNYDPVNHVYTSEVWDGSFKQGLHWTNNPVWLLYALLTNPRYGLGEVVRADQINKWSFYDAARYNDEKVRNGEGGYEPRFTFNGSLNSRIEAYDLLNNVAGTFRSKLVWNTGMVSVVQDRPKKIKGVVTSSNVIGGVFTYAGTSASSRHTAAKINWINPADGWKPNAEIVEDNIGVQKLSWRQLDVAGYGITSRAQARRLGIWIMQTEINETQVVSYAAGLDQIGVGPGDIIAIADSSLNQLYDGGRVLGSDNDARTVVLDRSIAACPAGTIIWITTTDSDNPLRYFILAGPLDADWTGLVRAIDLDNNPNSPTGFKELPADVWQNYVFDFGAGATWGKFDPAEKSLPKLWRVLGTEEIAPGQVSVTALEYYSEKFAIIDALASNFETKETPEFIPSELSTAKVDADKIVLLPYRYMIPGITQQLANLSWETLDDSRVRYYIIEYSTTPSPYAWESSGLVVGNTFAIPNFTQATYYVRVGWVDDQGRRGPWSEIRSFEYNVGLFESTPGDVENFKLVVDDRGLSFTWDPVASMNALHYEIRSSVEDRGWVEAIVVDGGSRITGTFFSTTVSGRYFYIKALNVVNNESDNAVRLRNNIRGIAGLDLAAEIFRPASAANAADIAEINALASFGAGSPQPYGNLVSDWRNTASRWFRSDEFSYFLSRPADSTIPISRFIVTTNSNGETVLDYTPTFYPRSPLLQYLPVFDVRDGGYPETVLNFRNDEFDLSVMRTSSNGGMERLPSDELEATNGEAIGGFLYAEPFAVIENWDTLDFEESICVYKSAVGTDPSVRTSQVFVQRREVYKDSLIDMEVRRYVETDFGTGGRIRRDVNFLWREGTTTSYRRTRANAPALLVSKNKRPATIPHIVRTGTELEPREFGDRDFTSNQWYETSENMHKIGNKGYNKLMRLWFPIVDFGAAVEFNFDAEIDWYAERADNLTDHLNQIPDRVDITNTDPIPKGITRNDSRGTQFQLVQGVNRYQVPDFANSYSNQEALNVLNSQDTRLTLEMRYVNTSDLLASNGVERLRADNRFHESWFPWNREDDRPGRGRFPLRNSGLSEFGVEPSIFTATGRQKATAVWPSILISMPTGVYTNECSLWRAVIRSLILRFDVQDRVESGANLQATSSWTRVDYAPAFIRAPALVVSSSGQEEIRNQDNTGFEIRSSTPATFSFIARGFGYELTRTVARGR